MYRPCSLLSNTELQFPSNIVGDKDYPTRLML